MNNDVVIDLIDEDVDIKINQITANVKTERTIITPTTEKQVVEPNNGKYFDQVTVNSIKTKSTKVKSSKLGIQTIESEEGEYFNEIIVDKFELENKNITPSTQKQTYTSTKDGYDEITVNPVGSWIDTDIRPENIRNNVNILGVTGTMGANAQIKYANASTEEIKVEPDEGVEFLKAVYINPVGSYIDGNIKSENIRKGKTILGVDGSYEGNNKYQSKEVDPSATTQVVTPDTGYNFLDKVTVNPMTAELIKNLTPENIKTGVNILNIVGTFGGAKRQTKTVYPSTSYQVVTPDKGYDVLEQVNINPVTYSIDSNIKSSNIKKGVSILGIAGEIDDLNAEEREVTPSTLRQVILPSSGKNAISRLVVYPITYDLIPNLKSSIIKKDEVILGIVGTYEGSTNLQEKTVNPKSTIQEITADEDYDGLSKVTINAVETEIKEIVPSKYAQTINASSGKFIEKIEVSAIDGSDEPNLKPENIRDQISVYGVTGTFKGEGGGEQEYFGSLGAGTQQSPGIARALLKIPGGLTVTSGYYLFNGCNNLVTIPALDFSNITTCYYMFYNCSSLQEVNVYIPKATNHDYMFYNCSSLRHVELSNDNKVQAYQIGRMFYNCSSYNTVLDLRNFKVGATNSGSVFYNFGTNDAEIIFGEFTVRNTSYYSGLALFNGCKAKLTFNSGVLINYREPFTGYQGTTINEVPMGHAAAGYKLINETNNTIVNFGGFTNVGQSINTTENAYIINLNLWTALSHDSIINVFNGLYNLTGRNAQAVYLNANQIAMLTDDEIAIATNKNWNVIQA